MQNPYLNLLSLSWKYARGQRAKFIFIYFCFVIGLIISSVQPWLYGWFIDSIQRDGIGALKYGWIYVGTYLGMNLVKWLFFGFPRIMEQELGFSIGNKFLAEGYGKILGFDIAWHQQYHSGELTNRVRKAYEALRNFFQSGFMYFHSVARFFISAAAMIYFTPLFGLAALVLGVLAILVTLKFDKPLSAKLNETNEKEHLISASLTDSLSNIKTIKTLRLEKPLHKILLTRMAAVFGPFRKSAILGEWKWFVTDMFVTIIYGLTIIGFILMNWHAEGPFYVGGVVTLIAYIGQFTNVFYEFAWQYNQIVRYNVDVKGADIISNENSQAQQPATTETLPDTWKRIEWRGIDFTYATFGEIREKSFTLTDFSIKLEKGKKIAVIGESGSGKSTVLNLLRGLYACDNIPQVIVDGKKLLSAVPVYDAVVLFPQEAEVFENTILYNLTLGLPCEENEVQAACEAACLAERIKKLPEGLQTKANEKGVNLSGGEKQRLSLARGILAAKSRSIVLMDEPTSAVDPDNEWNIYKALFEIFKDKVIVSSLHRLYLLPLFDYIYIMKDGRILTEGSYQQLKDLGHITA